MMHGVIFLRERGVIDIDHDVRITEKLGGGGEELSRFAALFETYAKPC